MLTPSTSRLHIVADANIPAAQDAFGALGEVHTLPGREIYREAVRHADVVLVRSVTPVDAALVEGTAVRFVGSATAGTDHVDADALEALGVAFAHAPGSNATSVVEYVIAGLLATAADRGEGLEARTLGVVGAGQVGGRLVPRARALGLRVVVSDPPLETAGRTDLPFVALADLLRQSDVVSLHTSLTTAAESPWPTLGLLDAEALALLPADAWLVNAARGRVVDEAALRREAARRVCVLDVWPDEPSPDPALVRAAVLGTPHIAGYSLDGKLAGTVMLAAALRTWVARQSGVEPAPWDAEAALAPASPLVVDAPRLPVTTEADRARWLDALVRQAYDVRADDARFRAAMRSAPTEDTRADAFAHLRKAYPIRREWARYAVRGEVPPVLRAAVRDGLAMVLEDAG